MGSLEMALVAIEHELERLAANGIQGVVLVLLKATVRGDVPIESPVAGLDLESTVVE